MRRRCSLSGCEAFQLVPSENGVVRQVLEPLVRISVDLGLARLLAPELIVVHGAQKAERVLDALVLVTVLPAVDPVPAGAVVVAGR